MKLTDLLPQFQEGKFYVLGSNDGREFFIDGSNDGYEHFPEAKAYALARWKRPGNEQGEFWTNYAVFNHKGKKLFTTGC